jgi:small conductance mechanosensitive channel
LSSGHRTLKTCILAVLILCLSPPAGAADSGSSRPLTTGEPQVDIEELKLLLKPLPKSQLLVEADGWQRLLQEKSLEIARIEIAVRRESEKIEQTGQAQDLAEEAAEKLDAAADSLAEAEGAGDAAAVREAEAAAREAQRSAEELERRGRAAGVVAESSRSAGPTSETLEQAATAAAGRRESQQASKVDLLEQLATLRRERTALANRLRATLDALEGKTGEGDSETLARIDDYRLYAKAVGGVQVSVGDRTSTWIAIRSWLRSPEGGKRWLANIARFAGILAVAWAISGVVSSAIRHALARIEGTSRLLENFLVRSVRWIVIAIGLIMALSVLGVSVTPLLAVVGAAGFVVAFALQDSLSNLASGLMILFFKPFDEGDAIDAGGVSGTVQSMNLVSTTILTFDNKRMIVPNNSVWNGVITNATGVRERRVDLQFGIGYDDDVDRALQILREIVGSHPKVLKTPEPTIRLHALADSSVTLIARPWASTADYWDVNWDITREVKRRFDEAGIGIPYPQRDVHLFIGDPESRAVLGQLAAKTVGAGEGTAGDGGG